MKVSDVPRQSTGLLILCADAQAIAFLMNGAVVAAGIAVKQKRPDAIAVFTGSAVSDRPGGAGAALLACALFGGAASRRQARPGRSEECRTEPHAG